MFSIIIIIIISRNRAIYIAVSLKTMFEGTCQENFTTACGCFGLGTACVKALGALKKRSSKLGHAAGNVSTFFNSKSGNCLARRLSAVSVAKNHPKVFRYTDSN